MANGDVTIRLDTAVNEASPEIRALMPDYKASPADRIEAINQGSRFMEEAQQANLAAKNADAAMLNVQGNLGAALVNAYDQKMQTVEITSGDNTLYKGPMTPDLAKNLEAAVVKLGANLNMLAVQCEKSTFTSSQCEELRQTVPSHIISEAIGKTSGR